MWKRNNTEIVKPRKIDSIEASWILRLLAFFFSSRRRHTRWNCDWSSECALPICMRAPRFVAFPALLQPLPAVFANCLQHREPRLRFRRTGLAQQALIHQRRDRVQQILVQILRSEERRVGKECRSRWWQYHEKKKE